MFSLKKINFHAIGVIFFFVWMCVFMFRLGGDSPRVADIVSLVMVSVGMLMSWVLWAEADILAAIKKLEPKTAAGLDDSDSHQQRVINELAELRERLADLDAFILDNSLFQKLSDADRQMLERQSKAMAELTEILATRIERFGKPE